MRNFVQSFTLPTMKYPSSLWLCSLFAFLPITCAVVVAEELSGMDNCDIQAWVRAQDLAPGEIIPGQVKVQTNGPCDAISEYSLVLRFKERIWAKIPKLEDKLPEKPQSRFKSKYHNFSIDGWQVEQNSALQAASGLGLIEISRDCSWNEYEKKMRDPTLWEIAEEERVAFEIRHRLFHALNSYPENQFIHDFALLIPTTNYPPSIDQDTYPFMDDLEAERGNEQIYLYTVEVIFNNGSIIEVPAGYSSFNTVGLNSQRASYNDPSENISFTANFTQTPRMKLEPSENSLNISSDIEVAFSHGGHVEQGSTLNLTFTSSELRGIPDADREKHTFFLTSPFVDLLVKSHHRRVEMLFPELDVPAEIRTSVFFRCHHFPTSNDSEHLNMCYGNLGASRDEFRKPDWNTTTSVSLEIPKIILPSFDLYYQSLEVKLRVMLGLKYVRTQDLLDNSNENYPWTPITQTSSRENSMYFEVFLKELPITIHPRAWNLPNSQITHYLSPDARQPVFVDPCKADELSRLSVEERNMLAPLSKPVIKKGTDQAVRTRYHSNSLYYVGNTWKRKVLDSGLKVNFGENSRCGFSTHAQAQTGFMV